MSRFLAPTRRKLTITALFFLLFPLSLLLRAIPVEWDILDLRDLGGVIVGVLLGPPIALFDAATGSAFASRGEGFLVFPSLPELAFGFAADAAAFYLAACAWERWRPGARAPGEAR